MQGAILYCCFLAILLTALPLLEYPPIVQPVLTSSASTQTPRDLVFLLPPLSLFLPTSRCSSSTTSSPSLGHPSSRPSRSALGSACSTRSAALLGVGRARLSSFLPQGIEFETCETTYGERLDLPLQSAD